MKGKTIEFEELKDKRNCLREQPQQCISDTCNSHEVVLEKGEYEEKLIQNIGSHLPLNLKHFLYEIDIFKIRKLHVIIRRA